MSVLDFGARFEPCIQSSSVGASTYICLHKKKRNSVGLALPLVLLPWFDFPVPGLCGAPLGLSVFLWNSNHPRGFLFKDFANP